MSRKIDLENLSDDDVEYLRQRDRWQDLQAAGIDVDAPEPVPGLEGAQTAAASTEGEEGEEETLPYSEWTNDDLRAELSDREIDFPRTANKAELVGLLEEDDAAQ